MTFDALRFGQLIDGLRRDGVDGKIRVDNKHGRPFHWSVWVIETPKKYAWGEALSMIEAEQQMAHWGKKLREDKKDTP